MFSQQYIQGVKMAGMNSFQISGSVKAIIIVNGSFNQSDPATEPAVRQVSLSSLVISRSRGPEASLDF